MTIVLLLWAWWCFANLSLFILGIAFARHKHPYFNGFKVFIPSDWVLALTKEELEAVIMHELGHKAHRHVWKNLLRLLCFVPVTRRQRMRQELQADDFVTQPLALASALCKMSNNHFDLIRAVRLEARVKRMPAFSG